MKDASKEKNQRRKLELSEYTKERKKGVPPRMATNRAKKVAKQKFG